jgi:endonuclease/exonuclease/phosphatase (EEP) superfamily protein YafD
MLKKLSRFLRLTTQLLVYSYCGFLLLYFLLRLIFWDRLWIVAFIGSFIPLILLPILLLPLPAFFLIKKPGFSIVSSIACIWLLGWLHLTYFSPQSSVIADVKPLKILTLNTSWKRARDQKLLGLIKAEKADIVCLQEIAARRMQNNHFPQLKAEYPYQDYAYNFDNYHTSSAAILSKYPILKREKIQLAGHIEVQQRIILEIDNREVVLYNIEITAPWIKPQKILPFLTVPTYDFSQPSEEIQELITRIKQENIPVIVAGDFNLTDQSQDYHKLTELLQDSFKKSGWGFGFTWPTNWAINNWIKSSKWKLSLPLFRIDYLWHSAHWQTQSSRVLPTKISAHLPVVSELQLTSS